MSGAEWTMNRGQPVMKVTMDGHYFALLLPLNRGDVALEVGSDLLPGVEAVLGQKLVAQPS